MKKTKVLALLLACMLTLSGCGLPRQLRELPEWVRQRLGRETEPPETKMPTEKPTQPPTEAPTEKPTEPPTEAPTQAPLPEGTLGFEIRTERLEGRLSDGRLYSESVLEYPYFFGETPVETALNEEFAQEIAQRRSYYENEMDADERYQRAKEYGGDVDSQMPYYSRSTVTVGYNAHEVLSILRVDLNWGGGAHPYTEEMGRTYLHTGETLGYEDLLQGTERQRREVDTQYLTGTAASGESLRYATFYLTQTGMHFYINVGDAVERVEVELPFTDPEDYHISAYALLNGGKAPDQLGGYAGAVQRAMERLDGYGYSGDDYGGQSLPELLEQLKG